MPFLVELRLFGCFPDPEIGVAEGGGRGCTRARRHFEKAWRQIGQERRASTHEIADPPCLPSPPSTLSLASCFFSYAVSYPHQPVLDVFTRTASDPGRSCTCTPPPRQHTVMSQDHHAYLKWPRLIAFNLNGALAITATGLSARCGQMPFWAVLWRLSLTSSRDRDQHSPRQPEP